MATAGIVHGHSLPIECSWFDPFYAQDYTAATQNGTCHNQGLANGNRATLTKISAPKRPEAKFHNRGCLMFMGEHAVFIYVRICIGPALLKHERKQAIPPEFWSL